MPWAVWGWNCDGPCPLWPNKGQWLGTRPLSSHAEYQLKDRRKVLLVTIITGTVACVFYDVRLMLASFDTSKLLGQLLFILTVVLDCLDLTLLTLTAIFLAKSDLVRLRTCFSLWCISIACYNASVLAVDPLSFVNFFIWMPILVIVEAMFMGQLPTALVQFDFSVGFAGLYLQVATDITGANTTGSFEIIWFLANNVGPFGILAGIAFVLCWSRKLQARGIQTKVTPSVLGVSHTASRDTSSTSAAPRSRGAEQTGAQLMPSPRDSTSESNSWAITHGSGVERTIVNLNLTVVPVAHSSKHVASRNPWKEFTSVTHSSSQVLVPSDQEYYDPNQSAAPAAVPATSAGDFCREAAPGSGGIDFHSVPHFTGEPNFACHFSSLAGNLTQRGFNGGTKIRDILLWVCNDLEFDKYTTRLVYEHQTFTCLSEDRLCDVTDQALVQFMVLRQSRTQPDSSAAESAVPVHGTGTWEIASTCTVETANGGLSSTLAEEMFQDLLHTNDDM